jgi:hypothetical protein
MILVPCPIPPAHTDANYAQVGADVTATSLPWDSVIRPGSTVSSIGFYATWNNVTNSIPQVACETS